MLLIYSILLLCNQMYTSRSKIKDVVHVTAILSGLQLDTPNPAWLTYVTQYVYLSEYPTGLPDISTYVQLICSILILSNCVEIYFTSGPLYSRGATSLAHNLTNLDLEYLLIHLVTISYHIIHMNITIMRKYSIEELSSRLWDLSVQHTYAEEALENIT